jgi:hypothetical protein
VNHFRLRWQKLGGHIHVGVWVGTERQTTHGLSGRLIFWEQEWEDFVELMRDAAGAGELSAIEIVREDEKVPW